MTDAVERLKAALADHYRVDRELGAGGMATVYLAEDLKHQRKVAVKVLRPNLSAILGPERFLREITIAANLQHPHVLPLYDSGQADGFLYYVMPFVDGPSLRQKLLREGEFPIPDAVRILRDVADAMAYAHRHGVVHRDIKPENVMLSERHALVTDFGVAKAVSEATGQQTLTTAGVALGTPTYMAPEQATADPHTDHRADIYAFGVVAYELLTGQPPFTGPTAQAVLGAHVTSPADPVTKHRVSIPPALAALVMKCLEKKPADRWQSADQLVTQLEALLTSSGETTPTDARPATGIAPARRSLSRLWLGLGVSAVVVAGVTIGLFRRGEAKPPSRTRVVVMPFENRSGDSAWDHLSLLAADYISQTLLQTGLVQVVPVGTASQVASVLQAKPEAKNPALPGRVARATGAGIALSGGYYLVGDSLRFVVELTDSIGDQLLKALEPVMAGRQDPMPGLERLRRLIAGALVNAGDPRWWQYANLLQAPPSYEIALLMGEAGAAMGRGDFQAAIKTYRDAFALDTTYESARMQQAIAYMNLREEDKADSLLRLSERNRSRLLPLDKLVLGWVRAGMDGDEPGAYRAVTSVVDVMPNLRNLRQLANEAMHLNRPREALEILNRMDLASPQLVGAWDYWRRVTDAYHMLSDHDQELDAARKARRGYPRLLSTLWLEAQALAALGRAGEVKRLLDEGDNFEAQPGYSPGLLAMWSGQELLAHGDSAGAAKAFAHSLAWHRRTSKEEQYGSSMEFGEVLYYAGEPAMPAEVFRRGCASRMATPECLGYLGLVAARLAQTDSALALKDAIGQTDSTPRKLIAVQAFYQARVMAALGKRDEAVELLRRSFAHGREHGPADHRVYEFHALRDYPPFKELLKPKD